MSPILFNNMEIVKMNQYTTIEQLLTVILKYKELTNESVKDLSIIWVQLPPIIYQ